MKIKDILNIKNIKSFIEGNAKYHYDQLVGLPDYIKEQHIYRLSQCKEDCVPQGKCIECGCPTEKKIYVNESCNPDRFSDIMSEEKWIEFKKENKIND